MKKLSLKNLKLEASDMLQRDQLKTVFGGYNGNSSDTCCNTITYDDGYQYRNCGGKTEAQARALVGTRFENLGGFGPATVTHWCCKSC